MAPLKKIEKIFFAFSGIAIMALCIFLVFQEPIHQYFFLSDNEATMQKLTEPKQLNAVKNSIAEYFGNTNETYSLQDLFEWQNHHLRYVDSFPWFGLGRPAADPVDILNAGIGRCGEFSIIFTAACLAEGYEARLAVVVKSDYSSGPHEFCEVKINGTWTQVDSSCHAPNKLIINDTSVYKNWSWWPLGNSYSIFDFDKNNGYNITSSFVQ